MGTEKILTEVSTYYTGKVKEFGATPRGVDWNGEESQHVRFDELTRVIKPSTEKISILDYGCGHGSMYDYMKARGLNFSYHGYDISKEMIKQAKKKNLKDTTWSVQIPKRKKFDYVIASGIFNVRLKNSNKEWLNYIKEVLGEMNGLATKGFSFNMLTSFSDKPFMRDYLYYADPAKMADYCMKNFSRKVVLNHGYQLYEFSILVKKII